MKNHRALLAKLLLLFLPIGCCPGCKPPAPAARPAAAPASRPVSLISPVDFFSPEQKRLGEHLGWNTGCYKIEYSGAEATLTSRLELWTQGRPEPRGGGSSRSTAGQGELSISVQDGADSNYQVRVVQSSGTGSSSSSGQYVRPKLGSWATSTARLEQPTELRPDEEMPVWALMLFKTGPGREYNSKPGESIFDQARRSDWALVLKVVLNPKKS